MRRKKDDLIPIEFNAAPGWKIRQRLRALDRGWQSVIWFVLGSVYLLLFLWCFSSPQTALLSLPLLLSLAALIITSLTSDEIVIGKGGISFPTMLGRSLQYSYIRLWTELDRAELLTPVSESVSKLEGSAIRITFRSGAKLTLPISRFSRDSLIAFVSAIEKWATECKIDKQFQQIGRLYDFEVANPGADKGAYTKFWEEELSDTYSFTAFVPLSPGKRLQDGRITVLKEIAAGGFAAIYLVRDDSGNQRILKESVLPQECDEATRERVKAQFVREATLLVRLSHPNIARVFDHFVELGRNYLILEYIEGADLRAHVRQHGRRSEEEALRWAAEIAETLSYLHQQEPPIVHRDITPDNLVLSPSGKVVLIDFGAANEFVGTATGTLIGKQSYMAPEQIRGKASPPSDLYSLGATIYFLLSGKDPEPLGVASIKAARADVSERTHQLIQDLTKLEQEQRISSAEAVLARIAECRDGLSRVPAG